MRDENNQLKGGNAKPGIRKQTQGNVSSEEERKKKAKNKSNLTIHQTVMCDMDKSQLPNDAVFKGYHSNISQDILIQLRKLLL